MSADRSSNPVFRTRVTGVAIGPDLLVVAGRLALGEGTHDVRLTAGDRSFAASAAVLPESSMSTPALAVISVHDDAITPSMVDSVHFGGLADVDVDIVGDGLAGLLRLGLSSERREVRERALRFLVERCDRGDPALPTEVSAELCAARAILRERLRSSVVDRLLAPSGGVELLVRVSAETYYVRGWIGHDETVAARLTLVSPEGASVELSPTAFRYARPDVADFYGLQPAHGHGFGVACLVNLATPSAQAVGWLLEVDVDGVRYEMDCPHVVAGSREARASLVAELAIERPPGQSLRAQHVAPAIVRVQEQLGLAVQITRVEQFGRPPAAPDVSIIVPLYNRIDFVEHQLAQFADDPQIVGADLVYVLDSPLLERQLIGEAERLHRLFQVPFRVVVLSENGGFSVANNRGASLARGRLSLLMNSDVLPDRAGWLGALTAFHDSLDNPGAVGPKLLYEDDSLQHAGMYFERPDGARVWSNEHYFKGLHRTFAPACHSRRVPAVSAACLLIRTAVYREVGGLRGMFVQGDFEDSDLCLRLSEIGFENWYAADVELYHLEGQSYPTPDRHANGQFNRWLHTHMWDARLEALMADFDDAAVERV